MLLLLVAVNGLSVFGWAHAQTDDVATHKAVIQQVYDQIFTAGDFAQMETLYAPDYVAHGYGDDLDQAALTAEIETWRAALPDFAVQIEVLIAEGDWAASRVLLGGTFENAWVLGDQIVAPTGEPVQWAFNSLPSLQC